MNPRLAWAIATARNSPHLWSHEHGGTPLQILLEAAKDLARVELPAQQAATLCYNLAQHKGLDQFQQNSCRRVSEDIDQALRKSTSLRKAVSR